VIVPTYNRANTIERAVQGVLRQTFDDFELIVVDDGSTDGTRKLLAAVVDDRLHSISQVRAGVSSARNAGIRAARGEVITFLDSDDEAAPNWLEHLVEPFADPHCLAVCAGARVVDETTGRDEVNLPERVSWHTGRVSFLAGTLAARTRVVRQAGGYLDGLVYSENTEFGMRLVDAVVANGGRIHAIDDVVVTVHREHSGAASAGRADSLLRIIDEHADRFQSDPSRLSRWLSIAGVDAARAGDLHDARSLFVRAWRLHPSNLKNAARAAATVLPAAARRVWAAPASAPTEVR
jgi:glycosyltransferase involved in cell wall biosynthesis